MTAITAADLSLGAPDARRAPRALDTARTTVLGTARTTVLDTALRPAARARAYLLVGVLAGVIVVDQASKWWGWRHAAAPVLNTGGDVLAGSTLSGWLADATFGALVDVAALVAFVQLTRVVARRRSSTLTLIGSALFLAGWISNLLDRLGLHRWTAPGSGRGVVDFIVAGSQTFNLADVSIIAGLLTLAAATARAGLRSSRAPLDPAVLIEPRMRSAVRSGAGEPSR